MFGVVLALATMLGITATARAAETNTEKLLQQREQVHWTTVRRQVLAFYYGWYGNPQTSGKGHHWEKVDDAAKTISASSHFPKLGAYDSHDVGSPGTELEFAL